MTGKHRFWALLAGAVVCAGGCGNGSSGAGGGATGGVGGQPALEISDVEPLSASGANWNDYVSAEDTEDPCPESATSYKDCLHGGELRVATLTGASDCEGITATDALEAFSWTCRTEGDAVVVRSEGLVPGRKLSDLIDFGDSAWRPNSVTVTDGERSASTSMAVWWSNPIMTDNDGGSLDSVGTIYVATTDVPASYSYGADRVALVVQPGSTLLGDDSGGTVVSASGRNAIWLEAEIDATGDTLGVDFTNVTVSRMQGVTVDRADSGLRMDGVGLTDSSANTLHDVTASNNSRYGVYATNSPENWFSRVTVDANDNWGFFLEVSSSNDITDFVTANNSNWGIHVDESHNTRLINATSANNTNWGLYFDDSLNCVLYNVRSYNNENWGIYLSGSNNSIAVNLLSANQRNYGIHVRGESQVIINATSVNNDNRGFELGIIDSVLVNLLAANNDRDGVHISDNFGDGNSTFINVSSAHNVESGIFLGSNNNTFSGGVFVGDNVTQDCEVDIGILNPGLLDTTCDNQGASDASLTTGIDLAASFVGKVTADSVNTDATDGTAPHDLIVDWVALENEMRTWGLDDGVFPSDTHDEDCSTGDVCRIWDWSLAAMDSTQRNVNSLPTADDTYVHRWAAATENDCNAVDGAVWDGATCSSRFVLNATERMGDGIGNDNGLCESDEDCVYAPNVGRYQGHGELVPTGSSISGGGVQNVMLHEYATNGR